MLNEQALTNQMAGSWKDEFWTIIFGGILDSPFCSCSAICKEWVSFLAQVHRAGSTCLYIVLDLLLVIVLVKLDYN